MARQYSKQKQTIPVTFIKLYMYQLFRLAEKFFAEIIIDKMDSGQVLHNALLPGLLRTSTRTASAIETSSPR